MNQNQTIASHIATARKVSARIKPCRRWTKMHVAPGMRAVPHPRPNGKGLDLVDIYSNGLYTATLRRYPDGWPFGGGEWAQIGIFCDDGEPRHDWRDMQRIKNDLVGEEWEAIELFPAESRLLDPSNYYTLYCAPKIAIGIHEPRRIILPKDAVAPQRGWEPGHEPKGAVRMDFAARKFIPANP